MVQRNTKAARWSVWITAVIKTLHPLSFQVDPIGRVSQNNNIMSSLMYGSRRNGDEHGERKERDAGTRAEWKLTWQTCSREHSMFSRKIFARISRNVSHSDPSPQPSSSSLINYLAMQILLLVSFYLRNYNIILV